MSTFTFKTTYKTTKTTTSNHLLDHKMADDPNPVPQDGKPVQENPEATESNHKLDHKTPNSTPNNTDTNTSSHLQALHEAIDYLELVEDTLHRQGYGEHVRGLLYNIWAVNFKYENPHLSDEEKQFLIEESRVRERMGEFYKEVMAMLKAMIAEARDEEIAAMFRALFDETKGEPEAEVEEEKSKA